MGTALILAENWNEFRVLFWLYQIVYVLIAVFTLFSVGVNITVEVSKIYEPYRRRKWAYIFASIQPLLLMLMAGGIWWNFLFVYAYSSITGFVITFVKGRPLQKSIGFGVVAFALLVFANCFQSMSTLYSILLVVHIINVVFCVSVSQYLDTKF